jgi:hypothetical protein
MVAIAEYFNVTTEVPEQSRDTMESHPPTGARAPRFRKQSNPVSRRPDRTSAPNEFASDVTTGASLRPLLQVSNLMVALAAA